MTADSTGTPALTLLRPSSPTQDADRQAEDEPTRFELLCEQLAESGYGPPEPETPSDPDDDVEEDEDRFYEVDGLKLGPLRPRHGRNAGRDNRRVLRSATRQAPLARAAWRMSWQLARLERWEPFVKFSGAHLARGLAVARRVLQTRDGGTRHSRLDDDRLWNQHHRFYLNEMYDNIRCVL